jgi:hypothetical protein
MSSSPPLRSSSPSRWHRIITCGEAMKRPDTPFPRHWFYYIALKLILIAAAVLVALYVYGLL